MTTPTKRDMLSLSDRAFRITLFYLMPALFIGGFAFLGWRQCSRAVPPEPAKRNDPAPQQKCRYRTGLDVKSGVSVTCPTSMQCVVCSVGECSTFNPRRCQELKP